MRSGVIVAGGRSSRFGEADKAVAGFAGTPMVRCVADRIAGVVDGLVVNCRPDQTPAVREAMVGSPRPVNYAEDETLDMGPVAGIRNGLAAASGDDAFVVACDMPFVEPAVAGYLFERAAAHEAAVPRLADGWFQTVQAVYDVTAMHRACSVALGRGDRRTVAALGELDYVAVEESELDGVAPLESFRNINTRAAFDAAQDRLDAE